MKRVKLFLSAVALTAITAVMGTGSAEAGCGQYGKIFYINQYLSSAYIYIAPTTTLPTYGYYYYTTDPEIMRAAHAAMASGDTVYMYGSVSTCPTTGTYRYAGTPSSIRTYKNY